MATLNAALVNRPLHNAACRFAVATASVALLLGLLGCSSMSSSVAYAGEGQRHQVRQGEVVQVAIFQRCKDVDPGPEVALLKTPPQAIIFVGTLVERGINFLSNEVRKHLERIARLHDVTYMGTAMTGRYIPQPDAAVEIHVRRLVESASTGKPADSNSDSDSDSDSNELVTVMHAVYKLEHFAVRQDDGKKNSNQCLVIVRPDMCRFTLTHAAVRLDNQDNPFHTDITLTLSTLVEDGGTTFPGNTNKHDGGDASGSEYA